MEDHIQRMNDNRLPKKNLNYNPEGRRNIWRSQNEMGRWFPGGRNRLKMIRWLWYIKYYIPKWLITIHINKSPLNVFTAVLIQSLHSVILLRIGGTNTFSLIYPHKTKSRCVMSGNHRGQSSRCWSFSYAIPIHRQGKTSFK